jgi:hypothetical protein
MELRDWVKERFGTADTATLLDESVYGRKELRQDKSKLEHSLRQAEKKMEKHHNRYQKLLQKGANAGELKQQQYAQKAKFEKKKYKIKKKKYKAKSVKLGTIISIEGMREVMSMHDQEEYALDDVFDDDLNAQELQGEIMDQMAQFGLELDDMKEVQDALDVDILDQDLEDGASEELELMQEMQAGDVSKERIDIEDNVDVESDDIGIDIEESQPGL